jgi:hypothetical protein
MKAIRTLLLLILVSLIGCSRQPREISFDTRNWSPGDTIWYRIQQTDSAHDADGDKQTKFVDKTIRFTILDTAGGATIEWFELHLVDRSAEDVSDPLGEQEWLAMYRLVYQCDSTGSIIRMLNYPEVKAHVDPMIEHYMDLVDLTAAERAKINSSGIRDSAWMVTSLLRDAELLHRTFGMSLTDSDTLELTSLQPYSEQGMMPYHVRLDDPPICGNDAVGWVGWGEYGMVDMDAFLSDLMGEWDQMDSLKGGTIHGNEQMTLCFDPDRSLPTFVSMHRTLHADDLEMSQRIEIFEKLSAPQ